MKKIIKIGLYSVVLINPYVSYLLFAKCILTVCFTLWVETGEKASYRRSIQLSPNLCLFC